MAFYVYRYVDVIDEQTKYVGVVYGKTRTLEQRIKEHMNDEWFDKAIWRIEYFTDGLNTRSDCEVWEGHLIATYKTYRWYNKAKKKWGECSLINNMPNWIVWGVNITDDDPNSITYQVCNYLANNDIANGSPFDVYDNMNLLTPIIDEESLYKRVDEEKKITKSINLLSHLNIITVKYKYEVIDFGESIDCEDGTIISPMYTTEDSNALYLLARGDVGINTIMTLSLTSLAKKFLKNA